MSRTKFELDDQQEARVDKWFEYHFEKIHAGQSPRDYSGAAIKFTFIPTGLGPSCKAECLWCTPDTPSHSIDFTIDDDGELATKYDEEWKVIPFNFEEYHNILIDKMKAPK